MAAANSKALTFSASGAAGCLVAWLLGQGLLAVTRPASPVPAASILERPAAPDTPVVAAQPAPPPPGKLAPVRVPAPPPPEMARRLKEAKAGTGDVKISLSWENRNDLDLWCVDPAGVKIYHGNKKPMNSAGWLDVDRNVSGDTDHPVENIFWRYNSAPSGTYKVFVNHYRRHAGVLSDPTPFKVYLLVDEKSELFDDPLRYRLSKGQSAMLIHTFTVKPILEVAAPPSMQVGQAGKNRMKILLRRKRLKGGIRLEMEGLGAGLSCADIDLKPGVEAGELVVEASKDAAPGDREAWVVASSGETRSRTKIALRVIALPPALAVSAPPRVEVFQGGANGVPVRLRRERFQGAVSFTLEGKDGLSLGEAVIPEGNEEGKLELKAGWEAAVGESRLILRASGGGAEASVGLEVDVKRGVSWSMLELLRIAAWTGVVAAGLALALVARQNGYLGRPLIDPTAGSIAAGCLVAGAVAGGLGQGLYGAMATWGLPPLLGFVMGWLLLGAVLGRGVGLFIPNLDGTKATVAGAAGALIGSVAFLLVTAVAGAMAGRLAGAVSLGGAVGLMVAVAERVSRRTWLEVARGPNERVEVNLGPEPVKVGGDPRRCTVFVLGAAESALRYWVRGDEVMCEDSATGKTEPEKVDRTRRLGKVELTVRSAIAAALEPVPQASKGPLPLPAPAAASPSNPEGCPRCGGVVPGPKGRRYCIICDVTY